ncbi:hypothetical protein DFP72DRAFT_926935 [Ephemerocybe angulata]|uniref:Uncharacterized protein n=1 Tax=Ephemerocybe angulata TaxID=980116 RepID=A0A8H6HDI7_9AGAR|nr:hypothetical protein DFP72DRAFT_926935 [Tulosesus angulatus]
MEPRIVPELLDLIVDEVEESTPTLYSLSLVSRRCAFRARRYIFKHVRLGCPEGTSPRDGEKQSLRLRDFLELVKANEPLGACVQSLCIRMASFWGQAEFEDDETFIENLPPLLQRLPSLTSIRTTAPENGDVYDWPEVPTLVKAAIADCCSRPTIRKVAFAGFWSLPFELLLASPGLESMDLALVSPPGADKAVLGPGVILGCTKLTELVLSGASNIIRPILLASPNIISSLKTLQMAGVSPDDWDTYHRILRVCHASLQNLILRRSHYISDVPLLRAVKHLQFPIHAVHSWSRLYVYRPEDDREIHDLVSLLSQHGTKDLDVLESLTLQVCLRTVVPFDLDLRFAILIRTVAWGGVDDYLCSGANRRFRVNLNFEVIVHTDSVDPHDRIEVTRQLSEGATTILAQTAKAGRLSTSVAILTAYEDARRGDSW